MKKLSLLRAEAVYNYFISTGLNGDKFEIVGRGENFPIQIIIRGMVERQTEELY